MKRMAAVALLAVLLLPGIASAGSSHDAALALGGLAALGTFLLGAAAVSHAAIVPPPVVVPPPVPPVVYAPAPPPPVVYAPRPPVVYAPPPVVYAPAPVYRPYARYHYAYGYGPHWRRY